MKERNLLRSIKEELCSTLSLNQENHFNTLLCELVTRIVQIPGVEDAVFGNASDIHLSEHAYNTMEGFTKSGAVFHVIWSTLFVDPDGSMEGPEEVVTIPLDERPEWRTGSKFTLYRSCWYNTKKNIQDAITVVQTITESIHQSHDGWTPQETKVIDAFLADIELACESVPEEDDHDVIRVLEVLNKEAEDGNLKDREE